MISPCIPLVKLAVGLLFFATLVPLEAQNIEKIAPRIPSATREGESVPAPDFPAAPPHSSAQNEEVLVGELKTLVIQPAEPVQPIQPIRPVEAKSQAVIPKSVIPKAVIPQPGVLIEGFTPPFTPPEPDKLVRQLSKEIGQPVSLSSINRMVGEIIKFYRAHDRPLVDITVPEQDITGGVLHLAVLESRLGEVRAEKNRWFGSSLLESQIRSPSGGVLHASRVLEDLQRLNENPFRQVNAIYTPGKVFGTTDLVLETQDRFPLRIYTGYENSGSALLGSERWLIGANWGNIFGSDHLLSYQFTTSDDFKASLSHSFSYTIPLPWRHTLQFFGAFSQSKAPLVVDNQEFRTGGESSQASFRYTVPLPATTWWKHDLFTGFDFKRSNNNLDFGGIRVFDKNTDIFQWLIGYEAQAKDHFGATLLNLTGCFSPGNLNAGNSDEYFDQSRKFARADYLYGRLNVERLQRLPAEWSLDLRANGQWADRNLLSSEQLGVGGSGSVRGLAEGAANGDEGLVLSSELRAPPVRVLPHLRIAREDQFQLLGFVDYGVSRPHDLLQGEEHQRTLASMGLGVRYVVTPYLSARCDYGWPLMAAKTEHSPGASFSVTLSY